MSRLFGIFGTQTKSNTRIPHEIQVSTRWANLLDEQAPSPVVRQVDGHEIWLIENVFSEEECAVLIEAAEEHGFGTTSYPKSYRGNLRLTTTDPSLSEAVWHRLRPLVPAKVVCQGATWDAVGLNECWRLAKYHPGDRFMGHCDANFMRSSDEMSMFTVNIYMNAGFEGGNTRFYLADRKEADLVVEPKTGSFLLFRQPPEENYYHDVEQLRSGLKYLFRSDLMYRFDEGR